MAKNGPPNDGQYIVVYYQRAANVLVSIALPLCAVVIKIVHSYSNALVAYGAQHIHHFVNECVCVYTLLCTQTRILFSSLIVACLAQKLNSGRAVNDGCSFSALCVGFCADRGTVCPFMGLFH